MCSLDACLSYTFGGAQFSTSSLIPVLVLLCGWVASGPRTASTNEAVSWRALHWTRGNVLLCCCRSRYTLNTLQEQMLGAGQNTQITITSLAVLGFFFLVYSCGTRDVYLFLWPASSESVSSRPIWVSKLLGRLLGTPRISVFSSWERETDP